MRRCVAAFRWLDKLWPPPPKSAAQLLTKIMFNQVRSGQHVAVQITGARAVVCGPAQLTAGVVMNAGFLSYVTACTSTDGVTAPATRERVVAKIRDDLGVTIVQSCMFWVPAHAVNFKFVPAAFRCVHAAVAAAVYRRRSGAQRAVPERRTGCMDGVPLLRGCVCAGQALRGGVGITMTALAQGTSGPRVHLTRALTAATRTHCECVVMHFTHAARHNNRAYATLASSSFISASSVFTSSARSATVFCGHARIQTRARPNTRSSPSPAARAARGPYLPSPGARPRL